METMANKNAQQVNEKFLEIITEAHALCNDLDMGTINVASELY
jgi:hypothetical protein